MEADTTFLLYNYLYHLIITDWNDTFAVKLINLSTNFKLPSLWFFLQAPYVNIREIKNVLQ